MITLSCPTCGSKLSIDGDVQILVCGHCGHAHMVQRGGGAISLAPMAQDVRQQLGEAQGELKALKAQRRKPPAWWVRLFGGGE